MGKETVLTTAFLGDAALGAGDFGDAAIGDATADSGPFGAVAFGAATFGDGTALGVVTSLGEDGGLGTSPGLGSPSALGVEIDSESPTDGTEVSWLLRSEIDPCSAAIAIEAFLLTLLLTVDDP